MGKGEPTWLAITETLLAVTLFWGMAWHFDTHLHLLISITVAPFLLLRSPASMEKGTRWFAAYLRDKTEITPYGTPVRFWGLLLPLIFGITSVSLYVLAQHLLPHHTGWSLFMRAMLLGIVAMWITITVAVAGAVAGAILIALLVGMVLALALASSGIIALSFALAATVTLASLLALLIALAVLGAVASTEELFIAILLAGIPWITGIWLRALVVRIVATLHHPLHGLRALPDNGQRILWAIDTKHLPELMPNPKTLPRALSPGNIQTMIHSRETFDRFLGIVSLGLFFLPTLLYRWSIKSTAWFYWPLIYLRFQPKKQEYMNGTWLPLLCHGPSEQLCRWLTLAAGSLMAVTTFSVDTLQNNLPNAPARLLLLQAFDLNLRTPWQGCGVMSAILTGIIWFYSTKIFNAWHLQREKTPSALPPPRKKQRLLWLVRVRNTSTVALLLMTFGYTVLILNRTSPQHLWNEVLFLNTIYAPYLP